ncbi:MAG: hypothetical protein ABII95_02570 [Patescibacteria group bacterium]|nr:hypothetical protein [Patescibacteria group bacterium]
MKTLIVVNVFQVILMIVLVKNLSPLIAVVWVLIAINIIFLLLHFLIIKLYYEKN